jgi:hypothetical protein
MSFSDDYQAMGLEQVVENEQVIGYKYEDVYSQIMYKKLITKSNEEIPYVAIFTRKAEPYNWKMVGLVSDGYKFIGNASVVNSIRNSLSQISADVFIENNMLTSNNTFMYNELIVQNPQDVPEVGSIYPHILIVNSYNGFAACSINFGFSMVGADGKISSSFSFRNKIMKMRQIHYAGSQTNLSVAMGGYIESFTDNICDLVTANMAKVITEEEMLKTLEFIEVVGKRKREEISSYLNEIAVASGGVMTSWKLFQALSKFSAASENINAKKLLENVIERVLIVPQKMIDSLAQING